MINYSFWYYSYLRSLGLTASNHILLVISTFHLISHELSTYTSWISPNLAPSNLTSYLLSVAFHMMKQWARMYNTPLVTHQSVLATHAGPHVSSISHICISSSCLELYHFWSNDCSSCRDRLSPLAGTSISQVVLSKTRISSPNMTSKYLPAIASLSVSSISKNAHIENQ